MPVDFTKIDLNGFVALSTDRDFEDFEYEKVPWQENGRDPQLEQHAFETFVAWPLGGIGLLLTSRYWKYNWKAMHHAHNIIGTFVVLITLISCFEVYYKFDWVQSTSPHGILGLICMICCLMVGISGLICVAIMHRAES